ncbi:MAG: hypothetical protein OIF57_08635, partial [Marinobacterium sp.]|nr:hypothetical protein [Marinobacterium sp.]
MNTTHIQRRIRACQHKLKTVNADIAQLKHPYHHTDLLNLSVQINAAEFTAEHGRSNRQRSRARKTLQQHRAIYQRMISLDANKLHH